MVVSSKTIGLFYSSQKCLLFIATKFQPKRPYYAISYTSTYEDPKKQSQTKHHKLAATASQKGLTKLMKRNTKYAYYLLDVHPHTR